jgi:hypothetical protein
VGESERRIKEEGFGEGRLAEEATLCERRIHEVAIFQEVWWPEAPMGGSQKPLHMIPTAR